MPLKQFDSSQSAGTQAGQDEVLKSLAAALETAEARLRSERIRYQAILNSIGEGLIVIDHHGKITSANPYALTTLGFTETDLVGRWFPGAVVAVDEHCQPMGQLELPVIRALTQGRAVCSQSYYLKKDGSTIPVFITVSPIMINDKPVGAIEVFRNVSREKELDIAKDEFVSLASHQLKTPATGVKAILAMLFQGDFGALTPLQQKYLGKALESNDRQLEIVEDLLSVARIDSGSMELVLEYVDLADLARGVIRDQISDIDRRRQAVSLRAADDIKALVDPQKMRMVIDNLLSNASKYTGPGGEITVTLSKTAGRIILAVRDTGAGIAEADLGKLFHKFSRIDNQYSASVGGNGLGLYIAKNIVRLHVGDIQVQSVVGRGTTFQVTLPVRPPRAA